MDAVVCGQTAPPSLSGGRWIIPEFTSNNSSFEWRSIIYPMEEVITFLSSEFSEKQQKTVNMVTVALAKPSQIIFVTVMLWRWNCTVQHEQSFKRQGRRRLVIDLMWFRSQHQRRTCCHPHLIGHPIRLASVDTRPSSKARGNSYIRPRVLMELKEISGLCAKWWVTVSQAYTCTHRPIQVLAGYAYVTASVSRCLSPLQIKPFLSFYSLAAVDADAYVTMQVSVPLVFRGCVNEQAG